MVSIDPIFLVKVNVFFCFFIFLFFFIFYKVSCWCASMSLSSRLGYARRTTKSEQINCRNWDVK